MTLGNWASALMLAGCDLGASQRPEEARQSPLEKAQNAEREGSPSRALKIPGRPDQAGRQGLLKAPFKSLRPSYLGPVDKL